MKETIEALRQSFEKELQAAQNSDVVERLRVAYLGKKGSVTELLKGLKAVSGEEKKEMGQLVNQLKRQVEEGVAHRVEAIRAAEVSLAASSVSTVPEVRERMVALQRRIASGHSVVMDGRDIGTKVLPDATLKVFLTASAEVRARRRFHELAQKGMPEPYEKVLEELVRRDDVDTHRAASPLRMAEDAVEVDCSQMTLDEVVEAVAALARQALEAKA